MTDASAKQRHLLETQVERWTAEAHKLADAGDEASALELYRRAADELPGAPWLQHRTAELARKLKRRDVAISYFRRSASAFQRASFAKRAVAPLRTAWALAMGGLPGTSRPLVELAIELMQLQRRLGFVADATVTFERTNASLRTHGFSQLAASHGPAEQREAPSSVTASQSPRAQELPKAIASSPVSSIAPRRDSPPASSSLPSRASSRARLI